MAGVVLIDEIDLYLHPRWQAGLVEALRKTFPSIQFIATTHSPVVLSGLAPHEVVRVAQHPQTGNVMRWGHDASGTLVPMPDADVTPAEPDPRMMSGSEIYLDWFGIDRLELNPHGADLRTWLLISTNPFRSDADDAKLPALRERLEQAGMGPLNDPLEREPLP